MKRLLALALMLLTLPFTSYAAVSFNGSTQYLQTPRNLGISGAQPRTVSAWVYLAATPGGPGSSTGAPVLWWGTANNLQLFLITLDSSVLNLYGFFGDLHGSRALSNNTWYNIVVTYDGANTSTYVNAVQDIASAPQALNTVDSTVNVGTYSGWGALFNGSISDIRIYNRLLSKQEIRALYLGGMMNNYGIAAWWPMWSIGTVEQDISGKRNNLVPFNYSGDRGTHRAPPQSSGLWW